MCLCWQMSFCGFVVGDSMTSSRFTICRFKPLLPCAILRREAISRMCATHGEIHSGFLVRSNFLLENHDRGLATCEERRPSIYFVESFLMDLCIISDLKTMYLRRKTKGWKLEATFTIGMQVFEGVPTTKTCVQICSVCTLAFCPAFLVTHY